MGWRAGESAVATDKRIGQKYGGSHMLSLGYDSHVNSLRTNECDPVSKGDRHGSLLSLFDIGHWLL